MPTPTFLKEQPKRTKRKNVEKCILRCKDPKYLFDFPNEEIFRNLWLYQLRLQHFDSTWKVCDKHFTDDMFSSSNHITDIALPNRNLPDAFITTKNIIYEQMIKKIIAETPQAEPDQLHIVPSVPIENKKKTVPVSSSKNGNELSVKNWLNDSSNMLVDYQLRVQGKDMCEVFEIPEYIVVFTVVKVKESKKTTQLDLIKSRIKQARDKELRKAAKNDQDQIKKNLNPLLHIPSSITVTCTNPKGPAAPPEVAPTDDQDEIKDLDTICILENDSKYENANTVHPSYFNDSPLIKQSVDRIFYMPEGTIPRREREVQVDISEYSTECAIQCDVLLDNDIGGRSYNSYRKLLELASGDSETGLSECSICGEILSDIASKIKHESKHDEVSLLCYQCGVIFRDYFELKAHERDIHSKGGPQIRKALRCPKSNCKKAFHSQKQLNNHIEQHLYGSTHKCIKCMRCFATPFKLRCHQRASRCFSKLKMSGSQRWRSIC